MVEKTSQGNGNTQEDIEKQKLLEELQNKAITKLGEAIELNNENNRSEASRKAKAEACALILVAIRAGAKFDPQDPLFQIFVKKRSWRNAMERACKEVCNPGTAVARSVMNIINLLPSFPVLGVGVNVGNLIDNFVGLFKKNGVKPQDEAEVYNKDLWDDFYDDIPKKEANGLTMCHDLEKLEVKDPGEKTPNSELQKCLSERVVERLPDEKKQGLDVRKRLLKEEMRQQLRVSPARQRLDNVA